jgi:hypothetical protein
MRSIVCDGAGFAWPFSKMRAVMDGLGPHNHRSSFLRHSAGKELQCWTVCFGMVVSWIAFEVAF